MIGESFGFTCGWPAGGAGVSALATTTKQANATIARHIHKAALEAILIPLFAMFN